MKLNPELPLSDRFQARLAAQAAVRNSFDPRKTVEELRPDIKNPSAFYARMMEEPLVVHEVEKILNRTSRNAEKFKETLWDAVELLNRYLQDESLGEAPKHVREAGQTAMRLLGRAYLDPKVKGTDAATQSFRIDGLGDTSNLTDDVGAKKVQ